ncbi:reverse transcriptase domain-containing protein [Tanacetum coccineum]
MKSRDFNKDLMRRFMRHGTDSTIFFGQCQSWIFKNLHQLETFYKALTQMDPRFIEFATGGNFLDKMPRECLRIIESKFKVCNLRNKPVVAKVGTSTSTLVNQPPAYQAPAPQTQGVSKTDFESYVKANDAVMQNMQSQMSNITDLLTKIANSNAASTSGSGSLPSNTVANPKGELKAITTRSGASYDGPQVPPPTSSLPKVVENEPEVTKDTVPPTNNGSTKDVQPPVGLDQIKTVRLPNDQTGRALIDVYEGELTLRVGKEAVTFNLDQTLRYSSNYNDMTANQIDVIEMACEEYSQEVLGFSDLISSVDAFLALEDDPTSPEVDDSYYDLKGDILLLEAYLNNDPSTPPNQGNYFPEIQKELKVCEAKTDKSSINDPPEVELKDLPPHIEYAFLEGDNKLPIIIAKDLSMDEKAALIKVLKSRKRVISWKLSDIKGINPEFYTHKILMEEDYKSAVQHQRRVNPKIHDVIKKEVEKLLDARLIYPISDSPWRKLNEATCKDHFPLPFIDQMLERLARNDYYCFLDGFSGYFQIPIDPKDQEKTTFTYPYGTFAYRRMPFGLCNAPGMFQKCMLAIFHDMVEKMMEVFMDDFSVFRNSFKNCLSRLDKMLKRCENTNLCLNWEKSNFIVKEGIVLGHKISKNGIEVDKAKVDVIDKLPHPTTVKGVRSFLGHVNFYRRFIKDFSKISRPMTHLLEKNTLFIFSDDCIQAFQTLKKKLTEAPILIAPDWDLPFELMCDASGVVG